jgi:thiaminase/transcriptional activator TenA
MTLSQNLWQANHDLAQASLRHPFVQGIGDGTLAHDVFLYYVGQDAFYLEAFARAYTVAAARVPDWDDFRTLHGLAGGVFEELRLHEKFAAEWGVSLRNIEAGPTTRRYTDFLLATAWSTDVGQTAAAMSPCMRLYAYLGQELAHAAPPEHAYSDWIRTYSDPGIDELAQQLERLADRYAGETQRTHATYRYAMQCEYDFFQAAWETQTQ